MHPPYNASVFDRVIAGHAVRPSVWVKGTGRSGYRLTTPKSRPSPAWGEGRPSGPAPSYGCDGGLGPLPPRPRLADQARHRPDRGGGGRPAHSAAAPRRLALRDWHLHHRGRGAGRDPRDRRRRRLELVAVPDALCAGPRARDLHRGRAHPVALVAARRIHAAVGVAGATPPGSPIACTGAVPG